MARGYKNKYAVYAHHRISKKEYSEYVYDYNIVFAREQFQAKRTDYVIDSIRLSKGIL